MFMHPKRIINIYERRGEQLRDEMNKRNPNNYTDMITHQTYEQQLSSKINFAISSTFARQGCSLPNFWEHFFAILKTCEWLHNSEGLSVVVNALIYECFRNSFCHGESGSNLISIQEWHLCLFYLWIMSGFSRWQFWKMNGTTRDNICNGMKTKPVGYISSTHMNRTGQVTVSLTSNMDTTDSYVRFPPQLTVILSKTLNRMWNQIVKMSALTPIQGCQTFEGKVSQHMVIIKKTAAAWKIACLD